MRKYLLLALTAIVALTVTSAASAQSIQTIEATFGKGDTVKPVKFDKKKFVAASLFVDVETANNDEDTQFEQPPKANNTKVDFTTDLKFDPKAVDQCKVTSVEITNQPSATAKQLCGASSQVSVDGANTSGLIVVDGAPGAPGGTVDLPITITAFNGNGPNEIYLHSDPGNVVTKPVLVGKLVKGPSGFGSRLDVTVPPLSAGGIKSFKTTINAGKYVQARCKDKTPNYEVSSTYVNSTPQFAHSPTNDEYEGTCKQKKKKKKK